MTRPNATRLASLLLTGILLPAIQTGCASAAANVAPVTAARVAPASSTAAPKAARPAEQATLQVSSQPLQMNEQRTAYAVQQTSLPAELQATLQDEAAKHPVNSNAITGGPKAQAVTLASTPVGAPGGAVTFTTNFSASTTITGGGVYTLGATSQDFVDLGTGTCDTNGYPYTYAASTSCTTVVQFMPKAAGNRQGAEVLYTSTPGSYFYGYVNGIGTAPLVTFNAGQGASTLSFGLSAYGTATDGAGDLWVTDSAAGSVKEFVPTGGVYASTPTRVFTGFTTPQGIAVDGIGNVFVGDSGKGYIWKLIATNGTVAPGTAPSAYVTFTTAGPQPFFVSLDPTQTYLYFVAIYSGSNYLIYCTITTGGCGLVTTFTAPTSLAIDQAGYKYISESTLGTVIQLPIAYNSGTKTTLLSGLTLPTGIAADAAGDLYLATQGAGTFGDGAVTEYIATGGLVSSTSATRQLVTGLYNPNGVFVSSAGNLFIADTSNSAVKTLDLADAPVFSFPTTALNSTSSSKSVTLENIGNTSLSFSALTSTSNPTVNAPFSTTANGTTCPTVLPMGTAATLATGATCTYATVYSPTIAGAYTGSLNITDNNLNGTNAVQSVKMTGSTGGLTVTVVGGVFSLGSTATLQASIGYGSNTTPTGTPTITVNGSTAGVGAVMCNSKTGHLACSVTYDTSTLPKGQYTIQAIQPASGPYSATSGTSTITIN